MKILLLTLFLQAEAEIDVMNYPAIAEIPIEYFVETCIKETNEEYPAIADMPRNVEYYCENKAKITILLDNGLKSKLIRDSLESNWNKKINQSLRFGNKPTVLADEYNRRVRNIKEWLDINYISSERLLIEVEAPAIRVNNSDWQTIPHLSSGEASIRFFEYVVNHYFYEEKFEQYKLAKEYWSYLINDYEAKYSDVVALKLNTIFINNMLYKDYALYGYKTKMFFIRNNFVREYEFTKPFLSDYVIMPEYPHWDGFELKYIGVGKFDLPEGEVLCQ